MIINKENIFTYYMIMKRATPRLEIYKYIIKRMFIGKSLFSKDVFINREKCIFNCGRIIENCKVICELRESSLEFNINDGTFIDVGGHIGKHTIPMALRGGIKVISFEPNKNSFRLLKENIKLNNVSEVVNIFNNPLADKARVVEFFESKFHPATNSMFNTEGKVLNKIMSRTLDGTCRHIKDINAIKIDAEGAELLILKGAKQILSEQHPKVYFEAWTEYHAKEIESYMNSFGYGKLQRLNQYDYLLEITKYEESEDTGFKPKVKSE